MTIQEIIRPVGERTRANAQETRRFADEQAIVALTRRMAGAWDANDAESYGALFTEDCDYIAFDGTHLKGRDANARHHQALFDTVLKGSRLVFEGRPTVRFIAPGVAIMHAMGSVLLSWQDEVTPKRRSNQTYVVVRGEDGWRITGFHNTRYRPMTLPSGLLLNVILFVMRLKASFARAQHS